MSDPKTKSYPDADSADDIFGADDSELTAVEVPEWKRTIYLRVLPAGEGLDLNEKMQALTKERSTDAMFLLLGACVVDAKGALIFTDEDKIQRLRTRNQKVLLRIQQAALRLQGWLPEEVVAAKNA